MSSEDDRDADITDDLLAPSPSEADEQNSTRSNTFMLQSVKGTVSPQSSEDLPEDEEGPQRKRPRYSCDDEGARLPVGSASSEPAIRDDKFYLSDGSCVLLVEGTLFNVSQVMSVLIARG